MTVKDSTLITQKRLKELLNYNQDTGIFSRLINVSGASAGDIAGSEHKGQNSKSYIVISVDNRRYKAHRLACLYMLGYWPNKVDHENGNGIDNRWLNINLVTPAENSKNKRLYKNNKSGCSGVYQRDGKWIATIAINYKKIQIGTFFNMNDAVIARKMAEYEHEFHVNHGVERPL